MDSNLEQRVIALLNGRGQTAATAESCTGGLIGHRLTGIPGASACYLGGVIAYHNDVKEHVLGVPGGLLAARGAVSEAVAGAMAAGARGLFNADYALAVTGIAGPTGGTPEKPVGLVFIAVARDGATRVVEHRFSGGRHEIKAQTAEAALTMLLDWIDQ